MDWEKEFNLIVEGIDLANLKDPRFDELTQEEVNRAIIGMNEAATYLGRYLMQCMFDPETQLPEELSVYVRELVQLTDTISTVLSACSCPDCTGEGEDDCEDCIGGYICEECVRKLEEDEDNE